MSKACALLTLITAFTVSAEPALIDGGTFTSPVLLDTDNRQIEIAPFRLDRTPVTQAAFLEFIQQYPSWQPHQVPRIFADSNYLAGYDKALPQSPVTRVSWFAARAYCQLQGGRLPSLHEWEYVSQLIRQQDAVSDNQYAKNVFAWYSQPPGSSLTAVGRHDAGPLDIHDLHGLVNEWVEDFQLLISRGEQLDLLEGSCGDTARLMAEYDAAHYATFLRYQSRSNYSPQSTASNLGFRCAYNPEQPQ